MILEELLYCCGLVLATTILLYAIYSMVIDNKQNLRGKVVLITGASSGIGEGLSHQFVKAGSKVILAARSLDKLKALKQKLCEIYKISEDDVTPFYIDLSDHDSIVTSANTLLQIYGKIDVLVNNAGILSRSRVASTELSVYKRIMDVNFFGQAELTRVLLPAMIRNGGGTIVAVSSLLGRFSKAGSSAYAASKHALQAYFDSLKAEVYRDNIHVLVVSPGYVKTDITSNAISGSGNSLQYLSHEIDNGMTVNYCASRIIQAVIYRQSDVLIAPVHHKFVVYLRTLFPNLFHYIMSKYD